MSAALEKPEEKSTAVAKTTKKVPKALLYDPTKDERFGYIPQRDAPKSDLVKQVCRKKVFERNTNS